MNFGGYTQRGCARAETNKIASGKSIFTHAGTSQEVERSTPA
jgi:hypothetical protein